MTSLFLPYLLGKQPWFPLSNLADDAKEPHRNRNRLKKSCPIKEINSCNEILDLILSQSHLALCCNGNNANVDFRDHSESQPRQGSPPSIKTNKSNDTTSFYNHYEMRTEDLRRTRAKTPVYRIGQLEGKTCIDTGDIDTARMLAQQYQAALPPRGITPVTENLAQNPHRNGLRRVKCYDSLRDMVGSLPENDHASEATTPKSTSNGFPDEERASDAETRKSSVIESHIEKLNSSRSRFLRGSFEIHPNRRHSSDSETLVGSDSETSPNSPTLRSISNSDLESIKIRRNCHALSMHEDRPDSIEIGDNVGMQLCMDLLTNDLVTALYRQHPAEGGSRVSGLQILLMIEAYESLQQQLREEMLHSHVTEFSDQHVEAMDGMLDHWLQALRSIYEHSLSQDHRMVHEIVA